MYRYLFALVAMSLFALVGCRPAAVDVNSVNVKSASGVSMAHADVKTDAEGHTVEQKNVIDRLRLDNTPGSVKHLYIISTYSGQVLIYSPVRGKVTSSGKRLTPTTVKAGTLAGGSSITDRWDKSFGPTVTIGGHTYNTEEVLQDDGTYGSSIDYLYWFTPNGIYHQHYITGGEMVHISDQPVAVKNVILTLEAFDEKK